MSDSPTDQDTRLRREIDEVATAYDAYVADLTATPDSDRQQHLDAAIGVLSDPRAPADRRGEVLRRSRPALVSGDQGIACLLGVVGDTANPAALRIEALRALGAAAFLVGTFVEYRTRYRDLLRTLLGDDVAELREQAVSTLAIEHDPVLQETLAAGLRGERPLPVDRPTAIGALAEDDHVDGIGWLRELLASDSPDDRQEAVRYLGSYPEAADEVEAVLRDQDEYRAVRQQSAASLRALDPRRYQDVAKEIAADAGDYEDVRTTTLVALTRLGDTGRVYADGAFLDTVRSISDDASNPRVATAARELLDRGAGS